MRKIEHIPIIKLVLPVEVYGGHKKPRIVSILVSSMASGWMRGLLSMLVLGRSSGVVVIGPW